MEYDIRYQLRIYLTGDNSFEVSQTSRQNRYLSNFLDLLLTNAKIINQYHLTYTFCSGLNYVNYLNIIKRDHVSATVRTRLHLASGWSKTIQELSTATWESECKWVADT